MSTRRAIRCLLLAIAGLGLHGCNSGDSSSCQNLFGDTCKATEPGGGITATPNPVMEGKNVQFNVDIADPNVNEVVNCELDPEGDGSFQIDVACRGTFNYVYQKTGEFQVRVRVTDSQGQTATRSTTVRVTQAEGGVPVTQFKLVDLGRNPVSFADVCVVQPGEFVCDPDVDITAGPLGTYTAVPALPQDSPNEKQFRLLVDLSPDFRLILDTRVDNDNLAGAVTFLIPLDCDDTGCFDALATDEPGTIGTLSGVVTASDGSRIAGAQVSLTAGVLTGGPYSTVFTDANGQFNLLVNVGPSLSTEIAKSDLLIFAPGFSTVTSQVEVRSIHLFGLNVEMTPLSVAEIPLFRETFETNSPTADQWTVEASVLYPVADPNVKWQFITADQNIVNAAVPACVTPAPGDASGNRLLPTVEGSRAYWYGGKSGGNFLGVGTCANLNGGTSESGGSSAGGEDEDLDGRPDGGSSGGGDGSITLKPNSGTLTSPPINLNGISNPVRLTMKTFWEIESVNPNAGGFDLMKVLVSTDGGASFAEIGRLNPLSDPVFSGVRDDKPYTDTGFNSPPLWLQQESFALPAAVAGKTIRLRFEFDTVDHLFNGFRGWMIDEVVIERGQGRLSTETQP